MTPEKPCTYTFCPSTPDKCKGCEQCEGTINPTTNRCRDCNREPEEDE